MNSGSTSQVDPKRLRWGNDANLRARLIRQAIEKRNAGRLATVESAIATPGAETGQGLITSVQMAPPAPDIAVESSGRLDPAVPEELAHHPTTPWLRQIAGMDFMLASQLLSRLDIDRAASPSAFWAYCGFATVAATTVRCDVCGYERTIPADAPHTFHHMDREGGRRCSGTMRRSEKPIGRVPQALPGSSVRPGYDPQAKKICCSLGVRLRDARHRYESFYLHHRRALDDSRPDWDSGRKHVNALRRMQKLFLVHLYLVWADALGRPVASPKVVPADTVDWSSPWSMTTS